MFSRSVKNVLMHCVENNDLKNKIDYLILEHTWIYICSKRIFYQFVFCKTYKKLFSLWICDHYFREKYLIHCICFSGFIQNNRWMAQLCSWNVETSSLTPFQRNALRYGVYRNNCSCNVSLFIFSVIIFVLFTPFCWIDIKVNHGTRMYIISSSKL